jgi:hypothetical protein
MVLVTMSNVTTDMIISHEETDDDTEKTEYKKRNSEGNLFDWGFVVDSVRGSNHDILV